LIEGRLNVVVALADHYAVGPLPLKGGEFRIVRAPRP
jgi:hypothetical protein